ncbi:DNA replication factor C complex subunit Rfc1 [Coemansia javaensis]|uniref:DNA replication factor C complex subunit Rfc1 n=1 Tax=Coemansia javaensis TaxID=2761396 RepID=A0A9W8HGF6_9FUNG|nr:DNA replication factor C complex subunit Rfc1 [Coemansia javaensis]
MPRKTSVKPEMEIDPEDYFGSTGSKPKAKPKAKPEPKPEPKPKAASAKAAEAAAPSAEIGFAASKLEDVAPKRMFWQVKQGATGGGSTVPLPEGAPGCLDGLKFVVTGEFASMSREAITDLIRSFGGQVTGAVSGRTSYLVVGDDPGSTKIKKAKANNTRCLREDDLLALIRGSKPGDGDAPPESMTDTDPVVVVAVPPAAAATKPKPKPKPDQPAAGAGSPSEPAAQLWTEKYKPTKLKELCGHKENAKRILQWLGQWASGSIPEKRAVLISGPPGIGKTTTAHLVAKLAGFEVLELNASETRNRGALKDMLGSAIGNRSVLEFDRAKVRKAEADFENEQDRDVAESLGASGLKRMVVVMDEVDGMSGGDRGGSTELIQLVKRTRVPIICICNDRQSTKVRALAASCEDMRFRRPAEAQLRARINTIAFREGLKIEPNAIGQLVTSTRNDIRQIINLMSSYALRSGSMTYLDSKAFASTNRKETAIGPFDAIQKYLNPRENMEATFAEKIDLYYADYSIMPLFVQENYIDTYPHAAQGDLAALEQLSSAADLIAESDVVEARLRGSQQWGLMPLHAVLSCVGPAFHARGRHNGMYRFPGWLGQNSKATRRARQLREVQSHMRLRLPADKTEVRLSYIPALAPELTQPLATQGADGIPDVVATMDHYYLTKEHWDAVVELHMDGERILKQIPTAVKTAFTRAYNKGVHPVAFQDPGGVAPARKAGAALAQIKPDTEDVVDDDDDDDGIDDGGEDDATGSDGASDGEARPALTDKYPPAAVAGACLGAVVLAAVGAALAVLWLRSRRRRHCRRLSLGCDASTSAASTSAGSRRTLAKTTQEEEEAAAPRGEAQPLLSESAIRTRYASSPSEFARSLIDHRPKAEPGTPRSLAWPPIAAGPPPNHWPPLGAATENVIDLVATDSSGSSDSGFDSDADTPTAAQDSAHGTTPDLDAGGDSSVAAAAAAAAAPPPPGLNTQARAFVPAAKAAAAAAKKETQPPDGADRAPKRRCRFWPTCSNGRCKYAHPVKPCRAHPECPFGNSCVFVHPSDVQRIQAFVAGRGARPAKRRNDIIRINHLEGYCCPP